MTEKELKFIWGSRAFEDELKRQSEKIKKERGLNIKVSSLTFQLAQDLKDGRVILEPEFLRFRKNNFVRIGDKMTKLNKK